MCRSVGSRPADRSNLLGPHLVDPNPMVVAGRLDDVGDLLGTYVFRILDIIHDGSNAIAERVAILGHGPYHGTVASGCPRPLQKPCASRDNPAQWQFTTLLRSLVTQKSGIACLERRRTS